MHETLTGAAPLHEAATKEADRACQLSSCKACAAYCMVCDSPIDSNQMSFTLKPFESVHINAGPVDNSAIEAAISKLLYSLHTYGPC